jgi:hypothetical protein
VGMCMIGVIHSGQSGVRTPTCGGVLARGKGRGRVKSEGPACVAMVGG